MIVLRLLVLALVLSSCVPTLLSSKSWVRIAIAPDAVERNEACNRGFSNASRRNFQDVLAGVVDLGGTTSGLQFYSSLGSTYSLCYIFGFGSTRPSQTPVVNTFVTIDQVGLKPEQVKAQIALEADNGNVLQSIAPSAVRTDSDGTTLVFGKFTGSDVDAMNNATSFSFILDRGKGEERFRITRDMLGTVLLVASGRDNVR
jgi:hypothetical protein